MSDESVRGDQLTLSLSSEIGELVITISKDGVSVAHVFMTYDQARNVATDLLRRISKDTIGAPAGRA